MRKLALCIALLGGLAGCESTPPAEPEETTSGPASRPTSRPTSRPAAALVAALYRGDLDRNPYLGTAGLAAARADFEAHPDDALRLSKLASLLLQAGENDEAWELCGEARRLAKDDPPYEGFDSFIVWRQALSAFRKAEADNCVALHSPESCIFPLQNRAVHVARRGAELASGHLLEHLSSHEPDSLPAWRSRWLLNVAAMALETWPEGVPAAHRLPGNPFVADNSVLERFPNVAEESGLQGGWEAAGSVVVDDFDGDRDLDVLQCGWLPRSRMFLWINDGRGQFTEAGTRSGLADQLGGIGLYQADYDNDGDLDVFVVRGGQPDPEETPEDDDGRLGRNSLLRNEGDGSFVDVTHEAGLGYAFAPWSAAAWADFDLDGHVDLYVGVQANEARYPERLYRNLGDGTFADVANQAGIENARHAMSAVWGDYDDDGDPDLFISNYGAQDRLYRNQGGRFVDMAQPLRVPGVSRSHGAWWLDANGDGRLDLLVTSYGADIGECAASLFDRGRGGPISHLYINRLPLGFKDVAASWGLDKVWLSWSGNVGDVDGDGYEDIYLGTGGIGFDALVPNVLLRNDAGHGFTDLTTASGTGHLQKASGISLGDIDGDGDRDIVLRAGGCYRADAFFNALFENPGHGNRWLTLRLEGRRSNRAAIGARVTAKVVLADGSEQTIRRWVGSGRSFGSSTLRVELGLGAAKSLTSLEVRWPGGEAEAFGEAKLDQAYLLVEGAGRVAPLR